MKRYFHHQSLHDHVQAVVRKHGLSPQLAQDMMQVHQAHAEYRRSRDQALVRQWAEQAKQDPELHSGAGMEANIAHARDVVRRFGDAELRKTLDRTGMGNHPALIRFLSRLGRELQKVPPPKPALSKQEAAMRDLYPTMFKD